MFQTLSHIIVRADLGGEDRAKQSLELFTWCWITRCSTIGGFLTAPHGRLWLNLMLLTVQLKTDIIHHHHYQFIIIIIIDHRGLDWFLDIWASHSNTCNNDIFKRAHAAARTWETSTYTFKLVLLRCSAATCSLTVVSGLLISLQTSNVCLRLENLLHMH